MKQEVLGGEVLKKSRGKKKTNLKDSNEENIDIPEVIIYDITYYIMLDQNIVVPVKTLKKVKDVENVEVLYFITY